MTELTVSRLHRDNINEFALIHCQANGHDWCQCVAWWVPTWEGWGERTIEQNASLRRDLFQREIYDGYIVKRSGEVIGWIQAWKRNAFAKIENLFGAVDDEHAWMIGCVLVAPEHRRQNLCQPALQSVIEDLRSRGARTIDAFPKTNPENDLELWNGPLSTYLVLGFVPVREYASRTLLRLTLET